MSSVPAFHIQRQQQSSGSVWKWWHHVLFVLAVCWGVTWMIDAAQPKHPIRDAIGGLITSVGRLAMFVAPFLILDDAPQVQHYAIKADGSAEGGTQNHEFVEPAPVVHAEPVKKAEADPEVEAKEEEKQPEDPAVEPKLGTADAAGGSAVYRPSRVGLLGRDRLSETFTVA